MIWKFLLRLTLKIRLFYPILRAWEIIRYRDCGRIEFLPSDNPITELQEGRVTFRTYLKNVP